MLVKMGCKRWSSGGTQIGLRIYTPTIRRLETLLNVPSRTGKWDSLSHFLHSSQKRTPYSRDVLIVNSNGENPISATTTIAKHGYTSTQGYITAPKGTWLRDFVIKNLKQNFNFDYITTSKHDLLVVPFPSKNLISENERDEKNIKNTIKRVCKRKNCSPPQNAQEIGLYFEIQEVQHLTNQGLLPIHRYPSLTTKVTSLTIREISCDIDVLDNSRKFIKFVEVKSVTGPPGTEFNITKNEYDSREKCRKNGWAYEIVVYYRIGSKILERRTISVDDDVQFEPSSFWCYP